MHNRRSGMFRRRSNGRGYRRQHNDNEGRRLISGAFSNHRGRNNFKSNQSVEKLLERYKLLAKEALSSGDKTLAENYLQHADHFMRIIEDKNRNQNQRKPNLIHKPTEEDKHLSQKSDANPNQVVDNKE